jgi:hypothetical protein
MQRPKKFVILSEAKDPLSGKKERKQVLRFAQDDNHFERGNLSLNWQCDPGSFAGETLL